LGAIGPVGANGGLDQSCAAGFFFVCKTRQYFFANFLTADFTKFEFMPPPQNVLEGIFKMFLLMGYLPPETYKI